MKLKKQFISSVVRGTLGGPGVTQTINPVGGVVGTSNGSMDLPLTTSPLWGTATVSGNPALMLLNLGGQDAVVAFWPIPTGGQPQQTASPAGNITIPAFKSIIIPEASTYGAITYFGRLRLIPGSISYTVDLEPNDPSAVVSA